MKKHLSKIFLVCILFSSCSKDEKIPLDITGTLKGTIYTTNEWGNASPDHGNVLVELEGSDPVIQATTDSSGQYEINNIPPGTYNIIVSKEGYGEMQNQGFQIVGGDEPLYFNTLLNEKSSTTIENLSLSVVNGSDLQVQADVIPGPEAPEPSTNLLVMLFLHNEANPSQFNYKQRMVLTGNLDNNGTLDAEFMPNSSISSISSSGSKIYAVAYGISGYMTNYYDIILSQNIYTGLGQPSDVISVTMP